MAVSLDKPLPEGFETWSAQEKVEYIERLWGVVLKEHSLDELPVPTWQLDAAQQAWQNHQQAPESSRSGKDSIQAFRARLQTASQG